MIPVIDFIKKLSLSYSLACKSLCKEIGLPQTAFDILMFLANNPQYKRASDIVEVRHIKANLVSINVDKLVKDGYLKRVPIESDRRQIELVCLEKSDVVIEKGREVQKNFFNTLFSNVSDEQKKEFTAVMTILNNNLNLFLKERI